MKLTYKYLLLVAVILAAGCVLAVGAPLVGNQAGAVELREPNANAPTSHVASAETSEVLIESSYLYPDRVTVEYLVKGVSEEPRGNPVMTCPIRQTILKDDQGRKYGDNGTQIYCARIEPGAYRVVQDFFQQSAAASDRNTEFSLKIVVDLDANLLPNGVVGGQRDTDASTPIALVDEAVPFDSPQQKTHSLKFTPTLQGDALIIKSQQVERNGLKAELRKLEILSATARFELCLDLPDADNWTPEISLLQAGATQMPGYSVKLLNADNPLTFESSHRCYRFTFRSAYQTGSDAPPLRVIIERLVVPPYEGEFNELAACERVRQRLVEQATGIELKCQPNGDQVIPQIAKAPQGLSQEAAMRRVMDAYSRIQEGPWEFTVTFR